MKAHVKGFFSYILLVTICSRSCSGMEVGIGLMGAAADAGSLSKNKGSKQQ
jgi:hypothetical protein